MGETPWNPAAQDSRGNKGYVCSWGWSYFLPTCLPAHLPFFPSRPEVGEGRKEVPR